MPPHLYLQRTNGDNQQLPSISPASFIFEPGLMSSLFFQVQCTIRVVLGVVRSVQCDTVVEVEEDSTGGHLLDLRIQNITLIDL